MSEQQNIAIAKKLLVLLAAKSPRRSQRYSTIISCSRSKEMIERSLGSAISWGVRLWPILFVISAH